MIFLLSFVLYGLRAGYRLLREMIRLLAALLQFGIEQLRGFAAGEVETAKEIRRICRSTNGNRGVMLLKSLHTLLFAKNGVIRTLLRYAVPAVCCVVFLSAVRRGVNQPLAVAVTVDGKPVGTVASEADYMAAEEIVRKRLSYSADAVSISLNRGLQVEKAEGAVLTAGALADKLLQNAGIELFDGWGVYVNDEFVGAVDDTHPIEAALTRELSYFSDRMKGEIDDIWFADSVTYEPGSYLTGSRVEAQALANKLTAAEHTTQTYTAGKTETVYSVADRFSVSVEEIRRLNPDLKDAVPYAHRMKVPVVKRFLPIVYTKTVKATAFLDYETKKFETSGLPQGKEEVIVPGQKGEREQKVQVTFTDGVETGR
ncbi:MAG: G5 domain-containing protein, partial [Oscillospiraceae bacterium]|nr:G5 domain-containing protein [Oscillospiraceae bacterium]